jgi:hemerythrin-like domain-containing protein
MQPTDILRNEHRVIEQVLSCLERIAARGTAEGDLDVQAACQAVNFFRNFADRCHHGKEEARLFPALEARGISRRDGPIGVMLDEHEQGRTHLRGLIAAVEDYLAGKPGSLRRFAAHARVYVNLLREHIDKEDHCLFPMADRLLTDADQEALRTAFDQAEETEMGLGTHEKYLRLADELAERFGVPRAEGMASAGAGCGCGHHAGR